MFAVAAASASAATNVISTVAGNGDGGFSGDGGPAKEARLNIPLSATPLPGGGLLIADQLNSRVRRVAANGTITTIAGSGTPGFSGDRSAARGAVRCRAAARWFDPDRRLQQQPYPARRERRHDQHRGRHRRPGFSGDGGPATAAQLSFPADIDVAADGTYLIADNDNHPSAA